MRVFLILCLTVFTGCLGNSYNGYRVIKVIPSSAESHESLQELLKTPEISLWKSHVAPKMEIDVMVSPSYYDFFIAKLESQKGTRAYIMIRDVQKMIDEQMVDNELARKKAISQAESRIDNTFYRDLSEIYAELDNFVSNFPTLMSVSTIGTTYEGRDIKLMKVSSGGSDSRPIVWIDCGIHAREWVSTASCLFFLDSLSTYGSDAEITALIDTYDFYVLTVGNPDGYQFSWTDNRLWRKNRVPSGLCFGTDLNRNFDSDFGGPGTSDQPCADTYHGVAAFSELETQAIRDAVLSFNGRTKLFFSLHAYSQLWMTPYGYTVTLPADYDELIRVAAIGVDALQAVYGTEYQYGNIANIIYEAAGGSVDWTYDTANIIYSFAIEVRDTGEFGFLLPNDQIEPTATETWEGIKAAINAVV